SDPGRDPLDDLTGGACLVASLRLGGGLGDRTRCSRLGGRDHVSGCEPDAEQPALALGNDLELHALAIEPGNPLLEFAERRPLRLADGLARGLDGDRRLSTHLRVLPPRFRLTRPEPPPGLALAVSP